jgi:hypothetical protein
MIQAKTRSFAQQQEWQNICPNVQYFMFSQVGCNVGKFVQNSQFWTGFGQVLGSFNMSKTLLNSKNLTKTQH